ncbi:MAG: DNA polymerase III subunit delta [Pseudomonadota bacterium]
MKLAGAQATAFLSKPAIGQAGILLYGADAMRVALKRQALIKALTGPAAEEEMRLTRMTGTELRKEPALALDAMKAVGFFPGPRVVFVDAVGDGLTGVLQAALADWADGDATLVCTAGTLNTRSKLRKLFESDRRSVAIGIYDDPPGRDELEKALAEAGLRDIPSPAMADLMTLSRAMDPGELMQTIEKIGLYKHGDGAPLTSDDIAACLPATADADLDDPVHAAAEGRAADVVTTLRRLAGQGVGATTLCITATRHFRTLHAAATHPEGVDNALAWARPPVFGPRKDRLARQARRLGAARLERALTELLDTDLALRSSHRPPEFASVERAFIRIAMLRRD